MNKTRLLSAIKSLGIHPEDYVVIGSGLFAALELRDVDDIDLIVSESIFKEIESRESWKKKDFEDGTYYLTHDLYEIGLDWDSINAKPNLADLKSNEMVINDIPFVSPQRLISWKHKRGKQKDLEDIKLLENYLSK